MRTTQSPAKLGFTRRDRVRLEKASHASSDAREFRRLQAVLLVAQGRSIAEVALITGASERSVYGWRRRYLDSHHVADLRERPRSGRPAAAQMITDEWIRRELPKNPVTLGYSATTWTVKLLANHLSRTSDCPITERTLRRRLRAAGLRWKRPRYVFATKDPHRAQKKGRLCGG
jgi:transposase